MKDEIQNVELAQLTMKDYAELKKVTIDSYGAIKDSYWEEHQIMTLLSIFP